MPDLDTSNPTAMLDTLVNALNAMEEWVLVVDAEARVCFINRPYARFVGVNPDKVVGQPVTQVIENTRMHIAVQTGIAERASLHEIKGNQMIANRYPIRHQGKVIGAVGTVLFHDTHEWQKINAHIRALIAERDHQQQGGQSGQGPGRSTYQLHDIVGTSPALEALNHKVKKIAASTVSVLIRGESGTGKELYAHAIHHLSDRSDGPFIKVNCAAIPADLLESELFGYVSGAFTGASKGGKPGKFQLADGGTLFLDEIGDMSLPMQAKLLRVLQDRSVESLGATQPDTVDIRLIVATHQPLETLITKGEFRSDLYYRINVISLNLPPLRERPQDIPALTEHFLNRLARRTGRRAPKLTAQALTQLIEYAWPGNVRELENVLEAGFHLSEGRKIGLEMLPENLSRAAKAPTMLPVTTEPSTPGDLRTRLAQAERQIIWQTLSECDGNRQQAARQLGIAKSTLYEKLARLGL